VPSNYDNSAPFYDQLSRIIFGKTLVQAQVYLLNFVPPGSSVLIIGGGTGWILEELTKIHPSGLKITYVEISAKMTTLSQQRNGGKNEVVFINDDITNISTTTPFDVVITPFLLDNFTDETLQQAFKNIHQQLKSGGLWLCTDFQITGKLWQRVLLQSMYLFFTVLCRIETMRMPHIESCFTRHGYKPLTTKAFFGNFIISTQYKKAL
jgi:ubiquinone/menaquinone biosynthesis C-methylase UbiE